MIANTIMRLAKPHIDIGLFTNKLDSHLSFWRDTAGLRLDHVLDTGDGRAQHRFDAHGSVIKVNHSPNPLPALPRAGYAGLTIARTGGPAWAGPHPDGDVVRLVPPGTDGVVGIGITVRTPDPARMMDFYVGALEFEHVASTTARCGDSLLFFVEGEGGDDADQCDGPGFRYLTVQIYDADIAHQYVLARGGREGMAPMTMGTTARFSFVRDPDGNWIELSARASLIGRPVPALDGPALQGRTE